MKTQGAPKGNHRKTEGKLKGTAKCPKKTMRKFSKNTRKTPGKLQGNHREAIGKPKEKTKKTHTEVQGSDQTNYRINWNTYRKLEENSKETIRKPEE